jgi:UDP-hydrolysing UDP-N-acetyl-D-glucosamine 2-epimerase
VRTIAAVTGARSDYGGLVPVLRGISTDPSLRLKLFVTGSHLSPDFGLTGLDVERDFEITERVEMLVASDTPEAISKSIGLAVIGFAQTYARHRPDILLVIGDRFETLAAVAAALPFTIPIAHISGGEATEGAIDDAIRHAITKMSHLHFVSLEEYRRRVIQMGEEPWRVTVSGEPGLDNICTVPALSTAEIERLIGMTLEPRPLLVTFHPATLELGQIETQTAELLAALDTVGMPIVFTAPNADTEGRIIAARIRDFVRTHANSRYVTNLGTSAYISMMRQSAAMVGNSSSGIVEAASFELPVVNLGSRQRGRLSGKNVIHAELQADAIVRAIRLASSPDFRECLRGLANPYGDGKAAPRIIEVLKTVPFGRNLLIKTFHSTSELSATRDRTAASLPRSKIDVVLRSTTGNSDPL